MNTDALPCRQNTQRRRFCDRLGLTGLICLGLFIAFVQLLKHAGKF